MSVSSMLLYFSCYSFNNVLVGLSIDKQHISHKQIFYDITKPQLVATDLWNLQLLIKILR